MKITHSSSLNTRTTRERLAALLLESSRTKTAERSGISLRDMAETLGSSWEVVNRAMASLQGEGAIRIERHRMIINEEALERITGTGARVYVLLRTRECDLFKATALLRRQPGVMMADQIEGQSDVIFAVQAYDRESLARFMLTAIAAIEEVTEEIQLLPVIA